MPPRSATGRAAAEQTHNHPCPAYRYPTPLRQGARHPAGIDVLFHQAEFAGHDPRDLQEILDELRLRACGPLDGLGGTLPLRFVQWPGTPPDRLSRITLSGDTGKVTHIKDGFSDGPVAVTVVGATAYVLEGQLAALIHLPGSDAPAPEPKPFKATAVEVGKP